MHISHRLIWARKIKAVVAFLRQSEECMLNSAKSDRLNVINALCNLFYIVKYLQVFPAPEPIVILYFPGGFRVFRMDFVFPRWISCFPDGFRIFRVDPASPR